MYMDDILFEMSYVKTLRVRVYMIERADMSYTADAKKAKSSFQPFVCVYVSINHRAF